MRKNKKKFNTFFIKKRDLIVLTVILAFVSIFFMLSVHIEPALPCLKSLMLCELHSINGETSHTSSNEFRDIFGSYFALAEALPVLRDKSSVYNHIEADEEKNNEATVENEPVVIENTLPIVESGNISKNLALKNETTYAPDVQLLLNAELSFKSPEILIVHTHASESYKLDDLNYYHETDSDRTLDTNHNVVRVGTELGNELKNYGFNVTHARDINDYPSYNQSYNKTLKVINKHIEKNSNIQIVLDVHRDAVIKGDGSKIKMVSDVNGEKCAQVMIVCGTNQAGLENEAWQENLKFALKLQNYMETNYPGLARPLNLRQERFNTHATKGSIIIEVGTSGNTLNEALNSTKYLAKTIKEVLEVYR